MNGRPIEKLRNILGHSSVDVTERYAHLAPDLFSAADYDAVTVDFTDPVVLEMQPHLDGKGDLTKRMAIERLAGVAGAGSK
jgi:hypothetical protein